MTSFTGLNATSVAQDFKATGDGSAGNPWVGNHNIDAIAAGASVDVGAVADAAVITDTSGSLSGKLRGLVKWAFERMPASLGQKTMAASLPVVLASDQTNTVSPQLTYVTTATIAAGGQATHDSAQITSAKTGYLMGLVVSSSVMLKIELRTVLNGAASGNKIVWFERNLPWTTPGKAFISQAQDAGGGFDGFRVVITNMDTSEAADVYTTFLYDEV